MQTGQHDAKMAPHASPASQPHRYMEQDASIPKTLSLIVRFNRSVPTGPAKADCRTKADESSRQAWLTQDRTVWAVGTMAHSACRFARCEKRAQLGRHHCCCSIWSICHSSAPVPLSSSRVRTNVREERGDSEAGSSLNLIKGRGSGLFGRGPAAGLLRAVWTPTHGTVMRTAFNPLWPGTARQASWARVGVGKNRMADGLQGQQGLPSPSNE